MSDRPRILIFTGDGKGKTTAALGMALRAAGHGLAVHVIQFIKADRRTGELKAVRKLPGLSIVQAGRGFVPPPDNPQFAQHKAAAQEALALARQALAAGQYHMVVLDEICLAVAHALLSEQEVLDLIAASPPRTHLVLTGRGATPALIAAADTVTEMRPVKHLFDSAHASPTQGIEF